MLNENKTNDGWLSREVKDALGNSRRSCSGTARRRPTLQGLGGLVTDPFPPRTGQADLGGFDKFGATFNVQTILPQVILNAFNPSVTMSFVSGINCVHPRNGLIHGGADLAQQTIDR